MIYNNGEWCFNWHLVIDSSTQEDKLNQSSPHITHIKIQNNTRYNIIITEIQW